ncbi:hypothetical protein DMH04_47580 [Kibdelosporangium aridum]|uniref:Peptidase inhibitor family I36 n=2 Tax=Kibdelosporangium aridum TaxID=2030 RepID=A0A428YK72_KIBAR|nr:hypothetical protein DMH04_47580 [Kibdelosporangium aridum]
MAALGTAAVIFTGTAAAADADTAGRASGGVNPRTGGILADYNGRIIDLSQGWAGATVCMEQDDASVRCYDDVAEYRAAEKVSGLDSQPGTLDLSDCKDGYFCIWDNMGWVGYLHGWRAPGNKELADYGLRDRANGVANKRDKEGRLVDFRTFMRDPVLKVPAGHGDPDLGSRDDYPGGGHWRDKADKVELD